MLFKIPILRLIAAMLVLTLWLVMPPGAHGEDLLAFRVKDRDFKPVEIPDWVYDNWKVGFGDSEEHLEMAIQAGIKIMQTGMGPTIYYPLERDDPNSKPNDERAEKAHKFVTKA